MGGVQEGNEGTAGNTVVVYKGQNDANASNNGNTGTSSTTTGTLWGDLPQSEQEAAVDLFLQGQSGTADSSSTSVALA